MLQEGKAFLFTILPDESYKKKKLRQEENPDTEHADTTLKRGSSDLKIGDASYIADHLFHRGLLR